MYLASGVRASELLGMRGRDVDWGNSMIGVVSRGTRAYQQVPTSPDALTWLRLYLSDGFTAAPDEPLWWTVREPRRQLQYTAVPARCCAGSPPVLTLTSPCVISGTPAPPGWPMIRTSR